eukprot:144656-Rhodomonas_salina.4
MPCSAYSQRLGQHQASQRYLTLSRHRRKRYPAPKQTHIGACDLLHRGDLEPILDDGVDDGAGSPVLDGVRLDHAARAAGELGGRGEAARLRLAAGLRVRRKEASTAEVCCALRLRGARANWKARCRRAHASNSEGMLYHFWMAPSATSSSAKIGPEDMKSVSVS